MVITAVKPRSVFYNQGIPMATTNKAPVDTSSNPQHQPEKELSATEGKLNNLEKKLDQVIELLKQLTVQGDQKKRIPWE